MKDKTLKPQYEGKTQVIVGSKTSSVNKKKLLSDILKIIKRNRKLEETAVRGVSGQVNWQ